MLESLEASKTFSNLRIHMQVVQINRWIKLMMTIFGIRVLAVQMVPQVPEVSANNNLIKPMVAEIGCIEDLN